MTPLHRHGALTLLAALVLTTGCGPRLDLQDSPRLEALLPSPNAYPDGFDVDDLDVDEIQGVDFGGEAGADDFGDVEPAECAAVLNGGTGRLPAGTVEGRRRSRPRPVPLRARRPTVTSWSRGTSATLRSRAPGSVTCWTPAPG